MKDWNVILKELKNGNGGKYFIVLFYVSDHFEQFGGVLFVGGKHDYFGGMW